MPDNENGFLVSGIIKLGMGIPGLFRNIVKVRGVEGGIAAIRGKQICGDAEGTVAHVAALALGAGIPETGLREIIPSRVIGAAVLQQIVRKCLRIRRSIRKP